jgi:glutamate carboxypeptidase
MISGGKNTNVRELAARIESREHEMIALLQKLVEIESPTQEKRAVDALSRALAEEYRQIGAAVRFHSQAQFGDHLQASFKSEGDKGPSILLLGHMDTVWELGTLRTMPCRVSDGRVWGPGVLDMKAGIVQMIFALRALRDTAGHLPGTIEVLLGSDEEIGSPTSRPMIESLAKKAEVVFVLEPALGLAGALKTERKGVGDYTVKVKGKASHAGVDFRAGASAITELAYQIGVIEKFTDLKRGLTVNPEAPGGLHRRRLRRKLHRRPRYSHTRRPRRGGRGAPCLQ